MFLKKLTLSLTLLLYISFIKAQQHFLVEFEQFSPPVQEIIKSQLGQQAKNFMVKDLNHVDQSLSKFKGKKIVLWFWSVDNPTSLDVLKYMQEMKVKHKDVVFLALCNQPKEQIPSNLISYENGIIILPNCQFLGEAVYESDLGTPRIFFINKKGNIQNILPEEYLTKATDLYALFDSNISVEQ